MTSLCLVHATLIKISRSFSFYLILQIQLVPIFFKLCLKQFRYPRFIQLFVKNFFNLNAKKSDRFSNNLDDLIYPTIFLVTFLFVYLQVMHNYHPYKTSAHIIYSFRLYFTLYQMQVHTQLCLAFLFCFTICKT